MALTHEVCHVMPRKVAALARDAFGGVKGIVENRNAKVRLANLIRIWIDEAGVERTGLVFDGTPLVVKVARGLLDKRKQRLNEPKEVLSG